MSDPPGSEPPDDPDPQILFEGDRLAEPVALVLALRDLAQETPDAKGTALADLVTPESLTMGWDLGMVAALFEGAGIQPVRYLSPTWAMVPLIQNADAVGVVREPTFVLANGIFVKYSEADRRWRIDRIDALNTPVEGLPE